MEKQFKKYKKCKKPKDQAKTSCIFIMHKYFFVKKWYICDY